MYQKNWTVGSGERRSLSDFPASASSVDLLPARADHILHMWFPWLKDLMGFSLTLVNQNFTAENHFYSKQL